jgi:hypothetical protein
VLGRDELVLHALRLVLGLVEHAAERGRQRRLLLGTLCTRLLRQRRVGLRAERVRIGDEPARQVLIEQRDEQMLGIELGVAVATRELLRIGDRLLRLDRELVEVHQLRSGSVSCR